MNSGLLQQLLMDLGFLSALIMCGSLLRAKISIFQTLRLPASVIGGAVGLILGPLVLGDFAILRFSTETISTWGLLPGILILPIFAAVPFTNGFDTSKIKEKKSVGSVLLACGSFSIIREVQLLIGFGFTLLASGFMKQLDLYQTFGFELSQGFSGGHGTAGGVGNILQAYGVPYWETAQGIATSFATIGLIGGMLMGIWLIQKHEKEQRVNITDHTEKYYEKTRKNNSTNNSSNKENSHQENKAQYSMDTITLHIGVILVVCTLAYILLDMAKDYEIWGISSMPVWFIALLLMYMVNSIIKQLKLTHLFDKNIKNKIVGCISDFTIVAAMASIPVQAVMYYWMEILILSILGFLATYYLCFPMFKKLYRDDHWFERGILTFGVNTGVTINGMLLLKICDPNYESKALEDFSVGFALMSMISLLTFPVMYMLLETGSTLQNFLFACVTTGIYLCFILLGKWLIKQEQ